ncbi:MAG TPA: hypothetical protein VD962_07795 [Rubricoccaceae bacterium]|nr:hypothetical protein [Rubricoccaceae bacterium]
MKRFFAALIITPALAFAQPSDGMQSGVLEEGDPLRPGGHYYDAYTLNLQEGELMTVRMESQEFDTYLLVRSPSGQEQYNDDFGSTAVSQIDLLATEDGTWTVWATTFSAGSGGQYTLNMERQGQAEVRLIQDRLDRQDERLLKGEYVDFHTVESNGQRALRVVLDPLGFTGFLAVTDPSGTVHRSDSGEMMEMGGVQMLTLGPLPAMRGRWQVAVTTMGMGEVGAYDLRLLWMPPGN